MTQPNVIVWSNFSMPAMALACCATRFAPGRWKKLLYGNEERYHLLAWVVMPNHVHVLIEQIEGWPLD